MAWYWHRQEVWGKLPIFGLAAYMVSLLQVPLRSILAITTPVLSRAWKDKNLKEIDRIYNALQ